MTRATSLRRLAPSATALALGAATALAVGAALLPAGARAADAVAVGPTATWTGAGPSDTWSTAANWSAGAPPSGSVGALVLPANGGACVTWACSFGVDDLGALSVGQLEIDSSSNYGVEPLDASDQIALQDGLSFTTATVPVSNRLLTGMVVPITLDAAQTWSVNGVPGVPTQLTLGAVSGEGYPLTLALTDGALLQLPQLDSGPLTITGGGTVALASQTTEPADGIPVSPAPLIGVHGIRLANGGSLTFASAGAVSGPITIAPGSYSTLEIGRGVPLDGTVSALGNVTLRANGTVALWIDQPAATGTGQPQASVDNSQLRAFGDVQLNGASLALSQGYTNTQVECAALKGGQVYTLISATELTGTFGGIANGQVVQLGACDPTASNPSYAAIIAYNTHRRPETVTATIVGATQIKDLVTSTLVLPSPAPTVQAVLYKGDYTASFDAPATGRLLLSWTAVVHGRRTTIASGTNVAGRVGRRAVPLKLTAAGRKLFARSTRLTLTATANFTPTGESAVVVSRKIKLP